MRRAAAIGLLTLASVLLGCLAAGTPVAGNDAVTAITAGIELGTAPATKAVVVPWVAAQRRSAAVLLLQLLLVAGTGAVALGGASDQVVRVRDLLWSRAQQRRGPPAPA